MNRRALTVVALLAVPVIELIGIAFVADAIGAVPTVLLIVAGVVVGTFVVRSGLRSLRRATTGTTRVGVERAVDPMTWTSPLVVILAGIMLMIPGFVTDVVGLLLLIPGVRFLVLAGAGARLARRFPTAASAFTQVRIFGGGPVVTGEVIDGDVVEGETTTSRPPEDPPPALPR